LAGARALVAGALLYVWARGHGAARPERIHWREAAIVGRFLAARWKRIAELGRATCAFGVSALIIGSVLWMVLLEWLWHSGPRPTMGLVSGLVVGFAGLGFLVAPGNVGTGPVNFSGAVTLLLAAFFWAIGSLYSRRARLPSSQLLGAADGDDRRWRSAIDGRRGARRMETLCVCRVTMHSAIAWDLSHNIWITGRFSPRMCGC